MHTGGLKLPLLAALGLSNLTPEQIAILGPALSSQLGIGELSQFQIRIRSNQLA